MADDKDYEFPANVRAAADALEVGLNGQIVKAKKPAPPALERTPVTVAGLIAELRKFPGEAQVLVMDHDWNAPYELTVGDVRLYDGPGDFPLSVVLND